jgi:hypothetical protein
LVGGCSELDVGRSFNDSLAVTHLGPFAGNLIVAEQDQSPLRRVTVYYSNGSGVLIGVKVRRAR